MSEQSRRAHLRPLILILVVVLVAAAGCEKKQPKPAPGKADNPVSQPKAGVSAPSIKSQGADPVEPKPDPVQTPPKVTDPPKTKPQAARKKTLTEVVQQAITWGPTFTNAIGMPAPDFTLKDLSGKTHKLSDYRGKDVMIVFWASWCGPCQMEMPHLIALRKRFSPEKLAILSIATEDPSVDNINAVKQMATNLNYTVLLEKGNMPKPFGVKNVWTNSGIPCSFFIRPDGKIKIATTGALSLGDMRAIIEAE